MFQLFSSCFGREKEGRRRLDREHREKESTKTPTNFYFILFYFFGDLQKIINKIDLNSLVTVLSL